jgi:hypothetical protein
VGGSWMYDMSLTTDPTAHTHNIVNVHVMRTLLLPPSRILLDFLNINNST